MWNKIVRLIIVEKTLCKLELNYDICLWIFNCFGWFAHIQGHILKHSKYTIKELCWVKIGCILKLINCVFNIFVKQFILGFHGHYRDLKWSNREPGWDKIPAWLK